MTASTTETIATGWIVQHQEDDPKNPGWWSFSRPYWVEGPNPPSENGFCFPESIRWTWGTVARLKEEQARWDRSNA
jgi:hypothetical protein